MTRRPVRVALGLLGLAVLAHLVYWRWLHARLARWGATDEEIARSMPGDDLVREPTAVTNRAVAIQAPVEAVWPWLEQMGDLPRGGYYSYAWIERRLGMEVENANRLLPGLEPLEVGDAIDAAGNMRVRALQRGRALVLGPPPDQPWGDSSWAMCLYPLDHGATRLVSRAHLRLEPSPRSYLLGLVLGPGQFIMERKWLLGVRDRAERAHREASKEASRPSRG